MHLFPFLRGAIAVESVLLHPEFLFELGPGFPELDLRLPGTSAVAEKLRHVLHFFDRLHPEAARVDIGVNSHELTEFEGAEPRTLQIHQAVIVAVLAQAPFVCLFHGAPAFFQELEIPARPDIISHGNDVPGSRVGMVVSVVVIIPPIAHTVALRQFVRHFTDVPGRIGGILLPHRKVIPALPFLCECKSVAHLVKISVAVHRERVDEGVPSEEPRKSRPGPGSGEPEARDHPAAETRIHDHEIVKGNLPPLIGKVEFFVGSDDLHR